MRLNANLRRNYFYGLLSGLCFALLLAFVQTASNEPGRLSLTDVLAVIARPLDNVEHGFYLAGADISHGYLKNVDFDRADLNGADLSFSDFELASFKRTNLTAANLSGADFRFADLSGAVMQDANLSGATFLFADLSEAVFVGANLAGVDFSDAVLENATLPNGELYTPDTNLVVRFGAKANPTP